MANGPRPTGQKPKALMTRGLEARALRRKTAENITSPIVNSDRVFWYIPIYMNNRKIESVKFTVETTVPTV
jgi:hypothetical protein